MEIAEDIIQPLYILIWFEISKIIFKNLNHIPKIRLNLMETFYVYQTAKNTTHYL